MIDVKFEKPLKTPLSTFLRFHTSNDKTPRKTRRPVSFPERTFATFEAVANLEPTESENFRICNLNLVPSIPSSRASARLSDKRLKHSFFLFESKKQKTKKKNKKKEEAELTRNTRTDTNVYTRWRIAR